ncbi:Translation initiation factor IF-2 [Novipirellula aureliae]|uniref:Translation initiation factor IF-2 n=1 Tax=Novipirellula aureliae TaxID=2527966 RepID=A0A5C6E2G9_9BACT|nr:translation initiation factor IF-2 [Novipirellula aureliae]TWU43100.1 Translation initiation factor IF-2 [Novipirellula aureliae]
MPARIYALAKELNLDSKDLVDLVKKVGITGKGSALASLTDEEADKVREHIAGASKSAPPKAAAAKPMAAVREPVAPTERKPVAIKIGRPSGSKSAGGSSKPGVAGGSKAAPASPIRSPLFGPGSAERDLSGGKTKTPEPASAEPVAESPSTEKASTEKAGTGKPKVTTTPTGQPVVAKTPTPGPLASGSFGTAASAKSGDAKASDGKASDSARPGDQPKPGTGDKSSDESPRKSIAARVASKIGFGTKSLPKRPADSGPVAPIRSDASVGRSGGGPVRSLDRPSGGGDKKTGSGQGSKPKPRTPRINVKMASLPDAPVTSRPKSAPGEPKAQKPDIKLSKDVIAGHKQGMKAPLEQLAAEDSESKRGGTRKPGSGGLSGFTGEKGRKGPPGARVAEVEEEKPRGKKSLSGMASARAERSRGGGGRRRHDVMDRTGGTGREMRYQRRTFKRKGTNTAAPRKDKIQLELPCTVRSFSEAAGVPVAQVLRVLMGMQMMININSELDLETAELIATEMDIDIELKASETLEDEVISGLENIEDAPESLVSRPPIVTFLGHVDHGKTSLLDYLIGINVVSGEAGGITQHIRAYEVDKDGRSVTFVDTPGHEAFTEMRARGANVTDIAVLVIAADDGIMPQTEEAISHAKAAEVPIVVALNKCDLEGVDPTRVLTQLTEHQLTPSEWGGDVEVVRTSAITGEGMDELLETLLTIAEMNEYTANPNRHAMGVCIEAEQQGDRGVVSKFVVQNGTLRVGDVVVCGPAHGRVRAMRDTLTDKEIKEAGPSTPVNIIGLDQVPGAGDRFHVLDDITKAREIAESREATSNRESLSGSSTKVSFENFQELLAGGTLGKSEDKVRLNVIVRADVKGSLEAIDKELAKFEHPEVDIRVLQRSVGGVTLADTTLASASDAVILAFNVIPDEQARAMADERGVQIRRYEVIYKMTDDIKAMIEGRLKPEERIVELGRALVKQVFSISRVGTIAGCYVAQGVFQRGCRVRINRDGRKIGDYPLDSLKRVKEDVKEVPRGMECGIRLYGFNDIKQDDVLEAYKIEEVARTLD